MLTPTIDPTSTKHYGSGVMFSHLHRLIAAWVLCGTNRPTREKKIIKVFGSKRRRTNVLKHPERITIEETARLAEVIGCDQEEIMRITSKKYAPEFTLRLSSELNTHSSPQTHVTLPHHQSNHSM